MRDLSLGATIGILLAWAFVSYASAVLLINVVIPELITGKDYTETQDQGDNQ